jgi:hypothetical protein
MPVTSCSSKRPRCLQDCLYLILASKVPFCDAWEFLGLVLRPQTDPDHYTSFGKLIGTLPGGSRESQVAVRLDNDLATKHLLNQETLHSLTFLRTLRTMVLQQVILYKSTCARPIFSSQGLVVGLSRHGDGRARDLGRVQPAE